MHRPSSFAALALLVLIASACTDGGTAPVPPGPNTVSMSATTFIPASLTIDVGDTVTFTNPSGVLHNVTFSTAGAPSDVPNHSAGNNQRAFPSAGTFDYSCTNHAGMNGAIVVQ